MFSQEHFPGARNHWAGEAQHPCGGCLLFFPISSHQPRAWFTNWLLTLHFMSFHHGGSSPENISLVLSKCVCALCEGTGTPGRLQLLMTTCSFVHMDVRTQDPDCWVDFLLWLLSKASSNLCPFFIEQHIPSRPVWIIPFPKLQPWTMLWAWVSLVQTLVSFSTSNSGHAYRMW